MTNKLKVLQFQGLAPSVFCGLYFADQGAQVTFVARSEVVPVSIPFSRNILNRNKMCIEVNFKNPQHFKIIKELIKNTDIIIDPYRPGVLQKLKLGPKDLHEINKRVILLRVSGYGQTGSNRLRPGHDLNYLAVSGIVPLLSKEGQFQFPSNYMADFVSASLGITGVLGALRNREKSGEGGVVDCSLTDGCTYLAQNLIQERKNRRQENQVIRTIKIGEKEYIATGKRAQTLNQAQILALLQDKSYYKSGQKNLQISLVKEIGPFEPKMLKNPFSPRLLDNLMRKKGQNTAQIFEKMRPRL